METNEKDYDVIYIPDEDGNENAFEVLFYFEEPNSQKKYVFLLPEEGATTEGDTDEVLAFRYDEQGEQIILEDVETEEEWDMLEEVFHTMVEEEDEHDHEHKA